MARHPNVEILADRVIKFYSDDFQLELEKAQKIYEICLAHQMVFPKILDVNYSSQKIVFERLWGIRNIREHYVKITTHKNIEKDDLKLYSLLGRCLGLIHKNLFLSTKREWIPREEIEKKIREKTQSASFEYLKNTPKAYLHCDFGFSNIHYIKQNGEYTPVVLDPSANTYSSNYVNDFGSVYSDLGVFFSNIQGRISLKYYPKIFWNRISSIADSFLDGYSSVTGFEINPDKAMVMGYAFSYSHFLRYGKFGANMIMYLLYNKFKRNQIKVEPFLQEQS